MYQSMKNVIWALCIGIGLIWAGACSDSNGEVNNDGSSDSDDDVDEELDDDVDVEMQENASCERFPTCGDNVETILCTVQNGTHCGSYSSFSIAELAWSVLKNYSLP